jgi:hypothetical protein
MSTRFHCASEKDGLQRLCPFSLKTLGTYRANRLVPRHKTKLVVEGLDQTPLGYLSQFLSSAREFDLRGTVGPHLV